MSTVHGKFVLDKVYDKMEEKRMAVWKKNSGYVGGTGDGIYQPLVQ